MKLKSCLCLLCSWIMFVSPHAQSIFSFQYDFQKADDPVTYYAFLLKNNDGSGLLRIRFQNPADKQDVVIEMYTDEYYPVDKSGNEDTNTLVLKGIRPVFIAGDNKSKYTPPVFIFKYTPANDFFEPATVTYDETDLSTQTAATFNWQLMEGAALSKDFVAQFFSEDEDFYTNLFRPVTKGLSPLERNISLRLLVVADTLDSKIGPDCAKDLARIMTTFTSLTDYLGIKFFPKVICGKEYSKGNVLKAIDALKPSPNDIVVFYYTGHGFRIPEKPRRFPNLKLKNFKNLRQSFRDSLTWIKKDRQDNITYSLNIEDIFNSIVKKKARFNLVISDCCNNDIFDVNTTGRKPGKTKGSGVEWDENNIRQLFLNQTPLSILATGSHSGEKSTSNPTFGSFFSYYFKQSMEDFCSKLKKNPTWDALLLIAQSQTTTLASQTYCQQPRIPENKCRQVPDYLIKYGR